MIGLIGVDSCHVTGVAYNERSRSRCGTVGRFCIPS
jgi:hypothetical protein